MAPGTEPCSHGLCTQCYRKLELADGQDSSLERHELDTDH